MYTITAVALLVTMGLVLVRAILGPTLFDRILATNSIATKTTLLIAVIGFLTDRPDFLDIALLYALVNYIATLAVLRYVRTDKGVASDNGAPGTPPSC